MQTPHVHDGSMHRPPGATAYPPKGASANEGCRGPGAQRLGGALDRRPLEPERRGVRHVGDATGRERPVGRVEHVPDREGVADGEDELLRPLQQRLEPGGDPRSGVDARLAAARASWWRRSPTPRRGTRRAHRLRTSRTRFRRGAARRRAGSRGPRAPHRGSPAPAAGGSRRRGRSASPRGARRAPCASATPCGGEPFARRDPVDDTPGVRARVAVAREKERVHRRTER